MNYLFWILVGIILGWIIEWVIDWLFWRKPAGISPEKLAAAEAENRRLQAQLAESEQKLVHLQNENSRLQPVAADSPDLGLASHPTPTRQIHSQDSEATLIHTPPVRKDRLEEIDGIGPAFAKRLNEAGIYTFAQLAQQSPEQVREIINPEEWQKIEPESWIAQAKAMADPDPLEDIVGVGDMQARRLNEAGIYTFAQLAELTPERVEEIAEVKGQHQIDAPSWIAQARGFAFKKAQHTRSLGSRGRQEPQDPLAEIDGIGPVYARRLNEAGISSFWQLANMTPEQVQQLVNPEEWQKIDTASWIAQAKVMAAPDNLEDIKGIGAVFALRLNEAGIYTFVQLAQQTPEQVEEIIKPEEWQKIKPESWIDEAKEMAAQKSAQAGTGA